MPLLTAIILAGFVAYCVAWGFGIGDFQGNIELLLLTATVVTALYWLAERLFFLPRRRAAAKALQTQDEQRRAQLASQGITQVDGDVTEALQKLLAQPWWLDWTAGLFPVILIVFALRSFVFEPFRIPSGSMIPTLLIGDFVLVNKFTYGLKLPVLGTRITQGQPLQRGDVVVFHYPIDQRINYIKRVIGLPGDEVVYLDRQLAVNGQAMPKTAVSEFLDESTMLHVKLFDEDLGVKKHQIIIDDRQPLMRLNNVKDFRYKENCRYSIEGIACKVPEGHYLMMGDNRDNSEDSRYWGFVPDANIVGKAFFIWMNTGLKFKHLGSFN